MPDLPYPTILAFLTRRFPAVAAETWAERIRTGKIAAEDGQPIDMTTPYTPRGRLFYFREVGLEPQIPFAEEILCMDDELLAACKPHFLPVTPSGPYVEECLMNRLRKRTGNPDLQPLHRIDRATAGLVIFSCNRTSRGHYQELFRQRKVHKTYEALAACATMPAERYWVVQNRIVKGEPFFRRQIVAGEPNSLSRIRIAECDGKVARFILHPVSGRTHQLRLHMSALGFPILNDRFYPELTPESPDDFSRPLQLIAKQISFYDPLRNREVEFCTRRSFDVGLNSRET